MNPFFDAHDFDTLVHQRRSVFIEEFTGEKIHDTVVVRMLEHARWAPSHKLTQPWRFVVFTGEGLKRLADFQSSLYKEVTTPSNTFREERYKNLMKKPFSCSHIIAIGMKRDEAKSVPEVEELGAVFCAIQNLYLSAAWHGVGGYLSTGGITYFPEAKPFFGLGPDDKLIGFFHLGIPGRWPAAKARNPSTESVRWER
jgi:nitroreductase